MIIKKYNNKLKNYCEQKELFDNALGNGIDDNISQQAKQLFGAACILYTFRTEFKHTLSKIKSFDGFTEKCVLKI